MKNLPAGVDLSKLDIARTAGVNPAAFPLTAALESISQVRDTPKMGRHGRPRKVELDGYTFDSEREARRYDVLKALQAGGAIKELEVHPPYLIMVNGVIVCEYTPDFTYIDRGTDVFVVEDVKGPTTRKAREWQLVKKLWKAVKGFDITEVTET